jgi:hypothetical protein
VYFSALSCGGLRYPHTWVLGVSCSSALAYRGSDVFDPSQQAIRPLPETSIGVDRAYPASGGLFLDLGHIIIALRLKDKVALVLTPQTNDEVRDVVVLLAVREVGDRESESGVLDEGLYGLMSVYIISRGLLPNLRIGHHVVHVALDHFPNILARPVVDLRSGARATIGFEAG